jgi:predicted nucleic acid-binding protein
MRYWDTSAILPLVIDEPSTGAIKALYQDDADQAVWCLTDVEIGAALWRRIREGLPQKRAERIREDWKTLARRWRPVASVESVGSRALRLVQTHPLRAEDALQLGAALIVCGENPEALPFVCLDDRLRGAARREGFPVLPA